MQNDEFIYDLAISFVAADELLATKLADMFEGRLRVFLYSRKQEQLGGTDGEKTFNAVFGVQSRLVVVLYRAGWGETPWTRIEETAIRNRAFDEGYNFVLFIPLDEQPAVPKWLPKSQLWIGLGRWGITGAASVIDARFQELGGIPVQETIQHRAARLEKAINLEKLRKQYLSSHIGVQRAAAAFEVLTCEVERRLPGLQESAPSLGISMKKAKDIFVLLGTGPALRVCWMPRFSNSLTDSVLEISLWRGHPPYPGIQFYEEPRSISKVKMLPDMLPSEESCWVVQRTVDKKYLTPEEVAEFVLDWWLEKVIKEHGA